MATQHDHDLVAAATAKRAENPDYKPSLPELRAVDAVLIEQAKQRLTPSTSIQPPPAAPAQPEKTLAEIIADSFAAAVAWIKAAAGVVTAVKPGMNCIGAVTFADAHHAVQSTGRGEYTIHQQAVLSTPVEVGQSAAIKYDRDGRGTVVVRERDGRGGRV